MRSRGVFAARAERRVDRDERPGERAFAEEVLEKIGDPERCVEGVSRLTDLTEERGEQADPDQARETADEHAGGHGRVGPRQTPRELSNATAHACRRGAGSAQWCWRPGSANQASTTAFCFRSCSRTRS